MPGGTSGKMYFGGYLWQAFPCEVVLMGYIFSDVLLPY